MWAFLFGVWDFFCLLFVRFLFSLVWLGFLLLLFLGGLVVFFVVLFCFVCLVMGEFFWFFYHAKPAFKSRELWLFFTLILHNLNT